MVPLYVVCGSHGFSSDVCTVHWYLVHDLFHYFLIILVAIPILLHFNVFISLCNL